GMDGFAGAQEEPPRATARPHRPRHGPRQGRQLLLHAAVRLAGGGLSRGPTRLDLASFVLSCALVDVERTLIEALRADPADLAGWLALSDWLEEAGQGRRAELLRLRLRLADPEAPQRPESERRLRELLDEGAAPVVVGLTSSIGMELAL